MVGARRVAVLVLSSMGASRGLQQGWEFRGRFAFAPALVRSAAAPPAGVAKLALFGWTLGGFVALEYDESPVGPYLEVVDMGALVAKAGAVGQWGRELCVSTGPAEEVCRETWGVPARRAELAFDEVGDALTVTRSGASLETCAYRIGGWAATRRSDPAADNRGGSFKLPVLWTPQIKALWAPLKVPFFKGAEKDALNLHDLRLSTTSLGLLPFKLTDDAAFVEKRSGDVVPFGFALTADGLRIEIAPNQGGTL